MDGYTLFSNSCTSDSSLAGNNCLSATNDLTCLVCEPGYFLDPASSKCT